jgi:hypothetical protein
MAIEDCKRRRIMPNVTRPCVYFEAPGKDNTDGVVKVVMRRLAEGDVKTVVVSSTTGYTASKFVAALAGRDDVTLISVAESALIREWGTDYPSLDPETVGALERQGVIVADKVSYVFHHSLFDDSKWKVPTPEEIVRDTLYAFGQGLKVAVEVVLIAVAGGHLEPFQKVIAVGGTHRGVDTAIVMNATYPNYVFSQDPSKRLWIHEVLCKPI